jgi:hypothetical protein
MSHPGLHRFLLLSLAVLLTIPAQAQQAANIVAIVRMNDAVPAMVKPADLDVKIGGRDGTVQQTVSLAGKHLRYALLNDSSVEKGWPGGTREQVEAVDEFLKQVVTDSDRGSLINFADQIYIDLQDEQDPKRISKKLTRKGSNVSTFRDSVLASTQYLKQQAADSDFRKAVFVFSDGHDNVSRNSFDQLVGHLPLTNIPLFLFAPVAVENTKEGEDLKQLAAVSGGEVYFLAPGGSLSGMEALKRDLAASFLLTITVPASTPSGLADLSITSRNPQMQFRAPSRIAVP